MVADKLFHSLMILLLVLSEVSCFHLLLNRQVSSIGSRSFGSNGLHRLGLSTPASETEDNEAMKRQEEFQRVLKGLEEEKIPLYGVDANQVHTFQAALWTTMAELEESSEATKACLVFESIPLQALRIFVDDFLILKTQKPQMDYLPDLERFSISMVGKGIGPALLVEAAETSSPGEPDYDVNEFQYSAAMKAFMARAVVGDESYETYIGLGDEGSAEPILYGYTPTRRVCSAMANFWNCVCEAVQSNPGSVGSICLQLPGLGENDLTRFCTVVELMSRYLCLYRGDEVLQLVHFHPLYDRSKISPVDKPSFGHLPPIDWVRPMLNAHGDDDSEISDEDLSLTNFQHRSPFPAVNLVRNDALSDPVIATIELAGGQRVQASGLDVYCRNVLRLKEYGSEKLIAATEKEQSYLSS